MTGLNNAINISPVGGVGTSPIQIVPAEANRHFLFIQNISTVDIGISLHGGTPSFDSNGNGEIGTHVLPPLAGLIFDTAPVFGNAINAVAASGSANLVTVTQW